MLARGGTAVAIGCRRPTARSRSPWGTPPIGAAYPNKATLKITDGGDPIAADFVGVARCARRPAARSPTARERGGAVHRGRPRHAFRAMLAGEVIRTVDRGRQPPRAEGGGA